MNRRELIRRIREYLHDPEGKIWDNAELERMLDRAAESYSADTGIYRVPIKILVDEDGGCELPEKYLGLVALWNGSGYPVEKVSANELKRFYGFYTKTEGEAEYVYEDLDSIGRVRFCPNPYKKQNIREYVPFYPYGIPYLTHRGIPSRTTGYGIPHKILKFDTVVDGCYIRAEKAEKIQDHRALIYHVLWQAYHADSDFSDSGKAALYQGQYRARISRFRQMKGPNTTVRKRVKFY